MSDLPESDMASMKGSCPVVLKCLNLIMDWCEPNELALLSKYVDASETTKSTENQESQRAYLCADAATRFFAPVVVTYSGMLHIAAQLSDLRPVTSAMMVGAALFKIREAAIVLINQAPESKYMEVAETLQATEEALMFAYSATDRTKANNYTVVGSYQANILAATWTITAAVKSCEVSGNRNATLASLINLLDSLFQGE